MKKKKQNQYVIGVDGGGTKTVALMASLNGKIIGRGKAGTANPKRVGIKKSAETLYKAVDRAIRKAKIKQPRILAIYFAVAGAKAETTQRILLNELKKRGIIKFSSNIVVDGDLKAAFRAGTDEKEGVLLIAGTGSVAYGWHKQKEERVSGWGYLMGDEGSGYWIGQRILRAISRAADGRGPQTLLTNLVFKKLKVSEMEKLVWKIYHPDFKVEKLAPLAEKTAQKGDKVAREILLEAGEELALSITTLIKKLGLKGKEFPIVLSGSVFNIEERSFIETLSQRIISVAPKAKFIHPKVEPALGAVKLAIEFLEGEKDEKITYHRTTKSKI